MNTLSYYLLGIKGSAMANIAVMLKKQGHTVSGADVAEVFPTDVALVENNIEFDTFPVTKLPSKVDVMVYSAAHGGAKNPLVVMAQIQGIKTIHQAELLGELISHYKNSIAVAGCHGKTTTSSLLAYALIQLGQSPSYMVGTPSFTGHPGSDISGEKYFVIEADEYGLNPPHDKKPKFHALKPNFAIVTNIDFDHPDVFTDLEDTKQAFHYFMDGVVQKNPQQSLVLCADDAPLMDTVKNFNRATYVTYGESADADYQITDLSFNLEETHFSLLHQGKNIGTFSTKLAGQKNAINTAGVICMLIKLGFAPNDIQLAISVFGGAKRRFEVVGEKNGTILIDDYAHHPHELDAVISAAQTRFSGKRVIVIFQPHTFSRTEMLKDEFATALAKADVSIVAPIFASAREVKGESAITATKLAEIAKSKGFKNVFAAENQEDILKLLKDNLQQGDVILMAGAGDVYKLKNGILDLC